jgi:glycosyltransferase involved in cell wall biosynthesis
VLRGEDAVVDGLGSSMRICFVCSEYPPGPHGGIGTLTRILARALVRAGHDARVVGVYREGYPGLPEEEDNGVRVWRLREAHGPGGWLRSRIELFRLVNRWVRRGEIDLVEGSDWEGFAAGWRKLPIPVVVRLSGSATYFAAELGQQVKWSTFLIERASLRRADYQCSESRYQAERTREIFRLGSGPDAVIYNPVDISNGSGPYVRSRNQVVFAGTLTAKKGIISLMRVWSSVRATHPDAELHVFGKDGQNEDGQSMQIFLESRFAGPGSGVCFHGHVRLEELVDAFRTASVAVLPSYAEGFALTPLHAMAVGCPTIYTRRGSGPELIEDGRTGLLVDPDRPEEITSAILRVLSDDDFAARLGESGRQLIRDDFSIDTLIRKNEAFYSDCVARFSASRAAA